MANGSFDPEAKYAQLGERVDNQGRRINDLEAQMKQGFTDVTSQIRQLGEEFRGGSKTQWPIIIGFSSVSITVLGGLGFLALQPVKETIAEFKQTYEANRIISRQDYNERFKAIEIGVVPRGEHERVWAGYDQRILDLQRQLDEVKASYANTYGARDIIIDLRNRLDRLEEEKAKFLARP